MKNGQIIKPADKKEFSIEQFYLANNDHPGDPTFFEEKENVLFRLNSGVRIWYNDVSKCFPMHWHAALEICVCVSETYDVVTPDKRYHLVPGDILITPSGYLHACEAPATGTRFIYIIDTNVLQKLNSYSHIQHLFAAPMHITKLSHPVVYDDLMKTLKDMRSEYFSQNVYFELSIYSLLLKLFVTIAEDQLNNKQEFACDNVQTQKRYLNEFTQILNYIDEHYMEDITLEDAAAYTGFSKFHFSRLFKQYTSFTFCGYVNFRRLKACEELLSDNTLSITEVAMQSGFPSISTFNRLFLEYKGCSPSEFRSKKIIKQKW